MVGLWDNARAQILLTLVEVYQVENDKHLFNTGFFVAYFTTISYFATFVMSLQWICRDINTGNTFVGYGYLCEHYKRLRFCFAKHHYYGV